MLSNLSIRLSEKGVSGNKAIGCEAMVVCEKNKSRKCYDTFDQLTYVVNISNGGEAMMRNSHLSIPIRVFRSLSLTGDFGEEVDESHETNRYRYDGIYRIFRHEDDGADECSHIFYLERIPKGKDMELHNRKDAATLKRDIKARKSARTIGRNMNSRMSTEELATQLGFNLNMKQRVKSCVIRKEDGQRCLDRRRGKGNEICIRL